MLSTKQVAASALAAIVAISGIGSILIANHTPGDVQAVELSSEREGPPVNDAVDPAILRRNDAADDVLEAVDDDGDDPTGDGVTSIPSDPSIASAPSAQSFCTR